MLFLHSCLINSKARVIELIEARAAAGLNFIFTDKDGNSCIPLGAILFSNFLSEQDKLEIVKLSIQKHGADINFPYSNGNTLLHDTSLTSTVNVVTSLIGFGADVTAQNNDGQIPLHMLVTRGVRKSMQGNFGENFSEVVELMLARGAVVNSLDSKGYTPLSYCTSYNPFQPTPNITTNDYELDEEGHHIVVWRPLTEDEIAMQCSDYDEMILTLLRNSANPNAIIVKGGGNHLHLTVGRYHYETPGTLHKDIMNELLSRGVKLDAKDNFGKMPQEYSNGFTAIARLIVHDVKLIERLDLEKIRSCWKNIEDLKGEILRSRGDDSGLDTKELFQETFVDVERDALRAFYKKIQHWDPIEFQEPPEDYSKYYIPDPRISACLAKLNWENHHDDKAGDHSQEEITVLGSEGDV